MTHLYTLSLNEKMRKVFALGKSKKAPMTLMTETQMLRMRMREERRFCSQESGTLDRNHILPDHQSALLHHIQSSWSVSASVFFAPEPVWSNKIGFGYI